MVDSLGEKEQYFRTACCWKCVRRKSRMWICQFHSTKYNYLMTSDVLSLNLVTPSYHGYPLQVEELFFPANSPYLWTTQQPASNHRPELTSYLISANHHCSLCTVIKDPCEQWLLSGSRHMRRQHIYMHLIPRSESAIFLTMASYPIPFDHILLECQILSWYTCIRL